MVGTEEVVRPLLRLAQGFVPPALLGSGPWVVLTRREVGRWG